MTKKRVSNFYTHSRIQKRAKNASKDDLDDFQPPLHLNRSSSSSSTTTTLKDTRKSHTINQTALDKDLDDFQPPLHLNRSSSSSSTTTTLKDTRTSHTINHTSSTTTLKDTKVTGLNHLPQSIFDNYKGNLSAIAFIGLFGADGVNSSKTNYLGLTFQSIAFPHLYSILKKCGVQQPRLRFTCDAGAAKENAGRKGEVKWGFQDGRVKEAKTKLGLPSSHILDTDLPLATTFVSGLSKVELLVFILFWLAGDGHVAPYYSHCKKFGSQLSFTRLEITSRDERILKLMQMALSHHGLDKVQVHKHQSTAPRLFISKTDEMNAAILEALNQLDDDILHPKHMFIKSVLTSPTKGIPMGNGLPSELPYLEFAGDTTNRLQCLVAQDFYSLDLFEINQILQFGDFDLCRDIQEFDMSDFITKATILTNKPTSELTEKQRLFAGYFNLCRRRVLPTTNLQDWQHEMQPEYPCALCGKIFYRAQRFKIHVEKEHPEGDKKVYSCQVNQCNGVYNEKSTLAKHVKDYHTYKKDGYPCKKKGTERCGLLFNTKFEMVCHFENEHAIFVCDVPTCTKRYCDLKTLRKHQTSHQLQLAIRDDKDLNKPSDNHAPTIARGGTLTDNHPSLLPTKSKKAGASQKL